MTDDAEGKPSDPFYWQVLAASFRAAGRQVYPGKVLAIRNGSFCMHPVEDHELDSENERAMGVALWGVHSEFKLGDVRIETTDPGEYAVLISGEAQRPVNTGIALIDSWIVRADTLRWLRRSRVTTVGSIVPPLPQLQAAVIEIERLVRQRAFELLQAAPQTQRHALLALASVADVERPTDEALSDAIRELLVSVVAWKQAARGLIPSVINDTDSRSAEQRTDDNATYTVTDLAVQFQVPPERLRKRLERWRAKNPMNKGWLENADPSQREPRYLYRLGAVRPVIEALKAELRLNGENPDDPTAERPPSE